MNSTITYISNATTINPLSIQAATWSYVTNPYALRAGGCLLASGEQNCSQSCTNVDLVFQSGATFENCLAYPLISSLLGTANISTSQQAIEQYGIIPNDETGSRKIVETISNCFVGYIRTLPNCQLNSNGACSGDSYLGCPEALEQINSTGSFPVNATNPSQTLSFQCINSLCDYVASISQVSADVGGIGVWISYIIQISLCLIFWLVLEYFRLLHPLVMRRVQKGKQLTRKHTESKQEEMFVETVIDFHKGQCYFMSSILLAAIIATQQGGLGALSLQDIFKNMVLLSVLSVGGSLPIMFILFKLRLMGHNSWFSFLLSSISLVLSFGLVWSGGPHKRINSDLLDPGSYSIPSCGTINPTALCLQGFESTWQPGPGTTEGSAGVLYEALYFRTYAAFGLSLVFWLVLLADRFLHFDVKVVRKILRLPGTPDENAETAQGAMRHDKWIKIFFYFIDFLGCFGTIFLLALYLQDLVRFGIGSRDWTFGQIVALTIWVPPVAQYCYLQLHGVEGNRWHLPRSLAVVRRSRSKTSSDSDHEHHTPDQSSRPSSGLSYSKVPAQRTTSRASESGITVSKGGDDGNGHKDESDREKGTLFRLDDYDVGRS